MRVSLAVLQWRVRRGLADGVHGLFVGCTLHSGVQASYYVLATSLPESWLWLQLRNLSRFASFACKSLVTTNYPACDQESLLPVRISLHAPHIGRRTIGASEIGRASW